MAAKKKKTATKKAKRPAKKPVKRASKKPSRKAAKKAKKPTRKPAKKATRKPAKKATKKPARKAPKKAAKKAPKKAAKKKTAKKSPSNAAKTARASNKKSKKVQRVGAPKPRFRKPVAPKDTIRRPQDSEELKQKLGALAQATSQIRGMKRSLNKSFYEIGLILRKIEIERLYEVKGYGSFDAFVDREIDIGKQLALKIVRIVQTFLREAALNAGLERATAALDALEDDGGEAAPQAPPTTSSGGRSPIPFHKQ